MATAPHRSASAQAENRAAAEQTSRSGHAAQRSTAHGIAALVDPSRLTTHATESSAGGDVRVTAPQRRDDAALTCAEMPDWAAPPAFADHRRLCHSHVMLMLIHTVQPAAWPRSTTNMKQAKSASAAAAAPLDRSPPPAAAADGSGWRCQARCDHGDEAGPPALHADEQSKLMRGLQCSDPLCAYTAARQLARILRDQTTSGPDESLVCALGPVLALLLMSPHEQQQQQSHWGHTAALCPRGMGALQLLSHLSRLYVRSSSAIESESERHSRVAGGDATSGVATFMQAALPHLSAVSAACIEVSQR